MNQFFESEELFPNAASFDYYEKIARYFGDACAEIYSVEHNGLGRLWGEISLFPRQDSFFFDMVEEGGVLHLVRLVSVIDVFL